MGRFDGRTAVVTGGTSGIGRAIALRLGEQGARVCIAGRDEECGTSVAHEVTSRGGEGRFVRTDVADDAPVASLAATAPRTVRSSTASTASMLMTRLG